MNEKISSDMFRETLDRCSSGVHGDPFLAGRIIATGKGEGKMKRKMFTSFALAVAILFALAAAAYSASVIYRKVNLKGEMLEMTESPADWEYPEEARQYDELCDSLIDEVPDGECAIFSVQLSDGSSMVQNHKKQVKFDSWDEFAAFMADADQLTIPRWLPEYKTFRARVEMDLRGDRKYEELDYRKEGPTVFKRYRFDDESAVISGYYIYLDEDNEASFMEICSELTSAGERRFIINDSETAGTVEVEGASDALLIRSSGRDEMNRLSISRSLDQTIRLKDPACVLDEVWEVKNRTSQYFMDCAEESIDVQSWRDADVLLKIFNGE